ncbi:MAG: hypothetical protein Q8Q31_02660 [Nanoarchaeota archaeon]|nr:hypothetical protein [Nanoarchaeota archaeon]
MNSLDIDYFLSKLDPEHHKVPNPVLFNQQIRWRIEKPSSLDRKDLDSWLIKGRGLYQNAREKYEAIKKKAIREFEDKLFLYERRN